MARKKKFYETKEFLAQFKEWNQKLKDDGFPDIESWDDKGKPRAFTFSHHGCYNSNVDILRKWTPEKQRYYELARQHYWVMNEYHYTRASRDEKDAFYLYSHMGMSVAATARAMGMSYEKVTALVKGAEAEFMPKT